MAAVNLKSLEKKEVENILKGFDTILSDCDGVLWLGESSLKGVPETVKKLKENGKRFFYVTNNARQTRQEFSITMKALGFEAEPAEIVCTTYLIANYLKSINFDKKVYLFGESAIARELDSLGIRHVGLGPDPMSPDLKTVILSFVPDPEVGAVVMGLDEHVSYAKLMKAATYLTDPNVSFIVSSMDCRIPLPNRTIPGPGAIVKCVESCSRRKPIVLGKPEPYMAEAILQNFGLDPERTLLVGDNLRTDILMGKRCGVKTLLVLSGVTKENDIKALVDSTEEEMRELIPDYYIDSLADLHSYI